MRILCTCYTPSALKASDATQLERPQKRAEETALELSNSVASRPVARIKSLSLVHLVPTSGFHPQPFGAFRSFVASRR